MQESSLVGMHELVGTQRSRVQLLHAFNWLNLSKRFQPHYLLAKMHIFQSIELLLGIWDLAKTTNKMGRREYIPRSVLSQIVCDYPHIHLLGLCAHTCDLPFFPAVLNRCLFSSLPSIFSWVSGFLAWFLMILAGANKIFHVIPWSLTRNLVFIASEIVSILMS